MRELRALENVEIRKISKSGTYPDKDGYGGEIGSHAYFLEGGVYISSENLHTGTRPSTVVWEDINPTRLLKEDSKSSFCKEEGGVRVSYTPLIDTEGRNSGYLKVKNPNYEFSIAVEV